MVIHIKNRY